MVEITSLPLNVEHLIASVTHPSAGGMNIFVGNIRNFNATVGKKVIRLEYEAYEPMAVAEIEQIANQAVAKFGVHKWVVSHRIGIVLPGEAAVVVAVSTAHRKESFEACQFMIDRVKEKVPIWKKEVFEDGEVWVSAHP
jgi:molybdopterin synthase catalytic subunit